MVIGSVEGIGADARSTAITACCQHPQGCPCIKNTNAGTPSAGWNSQCCDKAVSVFKAIYKDEHPTLLSYAAAESSKSWTATPVRVLNRSGDHSCPLLN